MQGFNMGRYIPPEALDAGLSANQAAGKKHALGSRARKINQGILTVRFEMPFAIWCGSCPQPTIIAQGVRFNAEKKKVGAYHSTPILSFRMKHTACGGWIEIRTDPEHAEYVVYEGAKKRDYGEDKTTEGPLGEILTEEERERRRNNAFAALEGSVVDKQKAKVEAQRVEELLQDRERDWNDPYAANQRLRKTFRVERKVRQKKEAERERLQERLGFSIPILDESEADKRAASLVQFGESAGAGDALDIARKVASRPLFDDGAKPIRENPHVTAPSAGNVKTNPAKVADQSKSRLQQELRGNTRAAMDPFSLDSKAGLRTDYAISGFKRKANVASDHAPPRGSHRHEKDAGAGAPSAKALRLVEYDSD
ncbi:hypothetical protein NA57DRAFT_50076 [Rhizodiscina lignyota]|uniref:DUF572-domain-containing protein n=1 Tax=Rhizodiscina lignyota TaxID=1504668 RepID=A0A9P4M0P8_9PEZI|nr:hypothetical protein NA57DRAFT_50076 [Rhizodiscina lignyota]